MQYHLNGYRPGDPDHPPAERTPAADLPESVDVLIVGCGPAGLTLATQLSAFPDIHTRIVDASNGPLERGRADGISCRSMEMFQTFGLAHKVLHEAHGINEATFWTSDPADPGRIRRTGRVQDVGDDVSEMPHVIMNQARVHDLYLERMVRSAARLVPDYGHRFVGLTIGTGDHPVDVTLDHAGTQRRVRAKYVVGCDGAHSRVRGAIGRRLVGDSANQAWGVMDVLAVTDFPDIRLKSLIKTAKGNVLIIPREGGYLTRLYIELDKLESVERVRDRGLSEAALIAAAQSVLHPYRLDVRETAWWSVYEIGQRLCDRFDDGSAAPRVFIAGDACHTHSPKAGQGMNVSMGDALNLGWKLAAVLRGQADPALLRSYSAERRAVAQDLLEFDREWAAIMSERTLGGGAETPQFQSYFSRSLRYTAGVAVQYAPSELTGSATHQHLATGWTVGMRFHSAPVIRLADAQPMQLAHVVQADGRWRLFVCAGPEDPTDPAAPVAHLADWAMGTLLPRYTPPGADPDAVIDLRLLLQQGHRTLELPDLPAAFRPAKGRHRLIDSEKVFCPDPRAGDIHAMRGLDRQTGCLALVRPDQYVADILPFDARAGLLRFFDGVLRRVDRG